MPCRQLYFLCGCVTSKTFCSKNILIPMHQRSKGIVFSVHRDVHYKRMSKISIPKLSERSLSILREKLQDGQSLSCRWILSPGSSQTSQTTVTDVPIFIRTFFFLFRFVCWKKNRLKRKLLPCATAIVHHAPFCDEFCRFDTPRFLDDLR